MSSYASFVASQPTLPTPESTGQKTVGALQNVGKGILHPLTVAGTKIAQAGVAAVKLPVFNKEVSQQNSNTNQMNSLLAQMKTEKDPQKLASLKAQAHQLVEQATPNQAAEENNAATLGKLSDTAQVSLPTLGNTEVPAQQSGLTGVKQITGQGLEDAAYLYGGEGLGELGGSGIVGGALRGAATGAIAGAGAGAGQEMQQPESGATDVLKAGGEGALAGATTGGLLGAGAGALDKAKFNAQTEPTPEVTQAQNEVNSARETNADVANKLNEANLNQPELNKNLETAKSALPKAQENITNADQARQAATGPAVSGVKDINSKVSGFKTSLGQDFANGAAEVEKANPEVKLNLSNEQVQALNNLKENKNFSLPDKLDSEKNPFAGINVSKAFAEKNAGALADLQKGSQVSLSPTEAQNLITQLDRSTFKPDASSPSGFSTDQQRIGVTKDIKQAAQDAFGGPWKDVYSKYSQGRAAIDKIGDVVNLDQRATATDLNKQFTDIKKLSSTPEGKELLRQSLEEFKNTSGIDLGNPTKSIQDILDKEVGPDQAAETLKNANKVIAEAQKEKLTGDETIAQLQEKFKKAQDVLQSKKSALEGVMNKQSVKGKGFALGAKASQWVNYALRFYIIRQLYGLTKG